jgi:glycosyltransferase involved in cell wall biosynthesis
LALRILILTHHFPPEVSAGASRFYEMAKIWIEAGHSVTVVACVPNHPAGVPYPGYKNKLWTRSNVEGIDVIRVWTFLAPNRGVIRRALSFSSYLVSATAAAPFLPAPDIVISTVPHFFCGLAGYSVSRFRRVPWLLDIRDLWPDSIVSVGAIRPGRIIRMLQTIERFCYRRASHIVSASRAYLPHFARANVASEKISVVTNGVNFDLFDKPVDPHAFRRLHNLEGKFVASYVGTHGLAHELDVILEAASRLRSRDNIAFVLVGDGSERQTLLERCRKMDLRNVLMLPQLPRDQIPLVWAATDAAIVTLRSTPLFELVIPSKMFEAMVMRRPIILGLRGEAQRIVEEGNCGVTFQPGNADDLAKQVLALAENPGLCEQFGENGYHLVRLEYDREKLASKYLEVIEQVAARP